MQSFTQSYLNDYDILKNAQLGFELEFYSKVNYPITLETFNRRLKGIKVLGFKQYHSEFKPDATTFKLEPDLSGGFNMAELVTGVLPYPEARLVLVQILKIIQEIGYTTERSGIHINLSFNDQAGKSIQQLNPLKLILNMDESKIYDKFPDRVNNIYAKSIKNIIPYKGYDYSNSTASVLSQALSLPFTKYYGVNFTVLPQGRLEFRYVGGEDYENKVEDILDMLDYFTLLSWNSAHSALDARETKKLRKYLDVNINKYKSMASLNSFLAQFPNVRVEVDKDSSYEIVNTYFDHLYNDIFDVVNSLSSLKDCIINYDTETKELEIVQADIDCVGMIKNIVFTDCSIANGDFQNCQMFRCEARNTILNQCRIDDSQVFDSKVMESSVCEQSKITDCYFSEGILNGEMQGGVFRSGKRGMNARISDETKILNSDQNFFNLNIGKTTGSDGKTILGKKK